MSDEQKLASLIEAAVAKAMAPTSTEYACRDCGAKFETIPGYLDHRTSEYMDKALEEVKTKVEALKIPTAEEFLTECKDGLCAIVEETYNVTKKGEEAPPEEEEAGLFTLEDEKEEE